MTFQVGDSVKVKKAVLCPDDNSVFIDGWQGRIFELDKNLIGIRWDSITLDQMPPEYIKQSEIEGLDWAEMYLSFDDVLTAKARDAREAADDLREEMKRTYYWLRDKEGERIFNVIANADDELEAWNHYLSKVITFPFKAMVSEPQDSGPLDDDAEVNVLRIVDTDDLYGLLVKVTSGRQRLVFPLCDLTVEDKKSSNHIPVQDYCVWFANR